VPASRFELTLARGIRRVDEVQFVLDVRALEELPEPRTLRLCVAGKVEYDGKTLRQNGADVRGGGVLQPRGAIDEPGHVGDLAGKEMIQELVLHEKYGVAVLGQFSREGTFAGRHLAAQKNERRRSIHADRWLSCRLRLHIRFLGEDVCGVLALLTGLQIYPAAPLVASS